MVDHPRGQGDGGVEQGVADRLRAGGHLDEIAVSGLPEGRELRGRGSFLVGIGRHGAVQRRHEQVRVDADQPLGCLAGHRVGDAGAHVAALGHVARVAEAAHQLGPGSCGPVQVPADLGRLAREAVPGQGGQDEVEGILGAAAVRGRVGQRAGGVDQLHDGAGPAVGHDQRQRVLVRRLDVDEVDLHAVDLGRELGQGVELRLGLPPVVVGLPVARELLHRRQLHALRAIFDQLLGGQARRGDPAAQLGELLFGSVDLEGTDLGLGGGAHHDLPWLVDAVPDDLLSGSGTWARDYACRVGLSNKSPWSAATIAPTSGDIPERWPMPGLRRVAGVDSRPGSEASKRR